MFSSTNYDQRTKSTVTAAGCFLSLCSPAGPAVVRYTIWERFSSTPRVRSGALRKAKVREGCKTTSRLRDSRACLLCAGCLPTFIHSFQRQHDQKSTQDKAGVAGCQRRQSATAGRRFCCLSGDLFMVDILLLSLEFCHAWPLIRCYSTKPIGKTENAAQNSPRRSLLFPSALTLLVSVYSSPGLF